MVRRVFSVLLVVVALSASAEEPQQLVIAVQAGDSIQEAVDLAPEGAVLALASGVWLENVIIEKSLTIQGEGADRTHISGITRGLPTLWLRSEEGTNEGPLIQVQDITICDSPGQCTEYDDVCANGVKVSGYTQAAIARVAFLRNGKGGLFAEDMADVSLEDSIVSDNWNDAVEAAGIARLHVIRCDISENMGCGLAATGGAVLAATESVVTGNGQSGVIAADHAQIRLVRCAITGNGQYGVSLYSWLCKPYEYGTNNFHGTISGSENDIADNREGRYCPETWPWPDLLAND